MGQRRKGREYALQLLFQLDLVKGSLDEVLPDFWATRKADLEVRGFAEDLVKGVLQSKDLLDNIIRESAHHWKLERMAAVDRNVLRFAVFELVKGDDPPPRVVIDEAIEVAKKFGSEASGSFINGILDDIHRRLERGEIGVA